MEIPCKALMFENLTSDAHEKVVEIERTITRKKIGSGMNCLEPLFILKFNN
jgi:hypothetical protein